MKKYIMDFLKRGLTFSVCGPVIVAIVYAALGAAGAAQSFTPNEVCLAILSSALMAFIAAGISIVYEIERLPLFSAALIHGIALYLDYILVYLINGWLQSQLIPILIFTGIFIAGYAVIWLIIYLTTKNSTAMLNRKLKAN